MVRRKPIKRDAGGGGCRFPSLRGQYCCRLDDIVGCGGGVGALEIESRGRDDSHDTVAPRLRPPSHSSLLESTDHLGSIPLGSCTTLVEPGSHGFYCEGPEDSGHLRIVFG